MSANYGGNGDDFEAQAFDQLGMLLNAYFFLTDQARFERMRRLGWIDTIPRSDRSIIEAVMDSATYEYGALAETPGLTPAHRAYEEDKESRGLDRATLVRKYTLQAVATFENKLGRESRRIP
ncbi:MAG: hypothetical protein ABSG91_04510 [Syntrophobacteraceae bacterium]|jgi:hypothetical protein